jgi:hypothetical protein
MHLAVPSGEDIRLKGYNHFTHTPEEITSLNASQATAAFARRRSRRGTLTSASLLLAVA